MGSETGATSGETTSGRASASDGVAEKKRAAEASAIVRRPIIDVIEAV